MKKLFVAILLIFVLFLGIEKILNNLQEIKKDTTGNIDLEYSENMNNIKNDNQKDNRNDEQNDNQKDNRNDEQNNSNLEKYNINDEKQNNNSNKENKEKIDDWRLILVNYENELPENFKVELANIDSIRKFDKRAINELNQMLKDLKKSGIYNIWVQSAYRSVEYQNEIFNNKIDTYMETGLTKEEAENQTLKSINKPGTSEHNLGLAVDFNYVDNNFESLKGFKWLLENAENYGFILRYKKEKENITKIEYEPWHWRYVGKEHAKKINELDMCLEEYIKFLYKK